jgi:hypothetical protein
VSLFPDLEGRRAVKPAVVSWSCDVGVPVGIRIVAQRLGAQGAFLRGDRVVVVLGDGRPCWLNMKGEQVGRSPSGPVAILDDVPWPIAATSERINAP